MAIWHNCIAMTIQLLIPVLASLSAKAKRDSDERAISDRKWQLFPWLVARMAQGDRLPVAMIPPSR
jgi:hypothetical protein